MLRVVGANNHAHSKVCKAVVIKHLLGNYVDDPKPLTGSHSCACVHTASRRMDYRTPDAIKEEEVYLGDTSPLATGLVVTTLSESTSTCPFTNNKEWRLGSHVDMRQAHDVCELHFYFYFMHVM